MRACSAGNSDLPEPIEASQRGDHVLLVDVRRVPAGCLHGPRRDFRRAQQRPDVLDHGRFHHAGIEPDKAVAAFARPVPDRVH